MTKIKRRWERLSDEERKLAKEELILFFEKERWKIPHYYCRRNIKLFLQSVESKLYNMGVDDTKKALENRYEELKYDLDDMIDF